MATMDDDWARFVFLQSTLGCASLEQALAITEKALQNTRLLHDVKLSQTCYRRKMDVMRELKKHQAAWVSTSSGNGQARVHSLRKQHEVQGINDHALLVGSTTSSALRGSPATTQLEGIRKVMQEHRYELKALEMSSRHRYASLALSLAAVVPSLFQLTNNETANKFRHELFMEKVSTEPRRYFELAKSSDDTECYQRVERALRSEASRLSLMSGEQIPSGSAASVLGNPDLCSKVTSFLTARDMLSFGACGKWCSGARERGFLMLFAKGMYRKHREIENVESFLNSKLRWAYSDYGGTTRPSLNHVKALAIMISKLADHFFPNNSSPLFQVELPEASEMQKQTGRSIEETGRISTPTGLFVVRKTIS